MKRVKIWLLAASLWTVSGCHLLEGLIDESTTGQQQGKSEGGRKPQGPQVKPDGRKDKPFVLPFGKDGLVLTDDIMQTIQESIGSLDLSAHPPQFYWVDENGMEHPYSLDADWTDETDDWTDGEDDLYWADDEEEPYFPTEQELLTGMLRVEVGSDSFYFKFARADEEVEQESAAEAVTNLLVHACLGEHFRAPYFFLEGSTLMLERISVQKDDFFQFGAGVFKFGKKLPLELVDFHVLSQASNAVYQKSSVTTKERETHLGGDLLELTFRYQNQREKVRVQVSEAPTTTLSLPPLLIAGKYRLQLLPGEEQAIIDPIELQPGSKIDLTELTYQQGEGSTPWPGFVDILTVKMPGDRWVSQYDSPSGVQYQNGILSFTGSEPLTLPGMELFLNLMKPATTQVGSFQRAHIYAKVEKRYVPTSVLTGMEYENFWLQKVEDTADGLLVHLEPGGGENVLPDLSVTLLEEGCTWLPGQDCRVILEYPPYQPTVATFRVNRTLKLEQLGDLTLGYLPLRLQGEGRAKLFVENAGSVDLSIFQASQSPLEGGLAFSVGAHSRELTINQNTLYFDNWDLGKNFTLDITAPGYSGARLTVQLAKSAFLPEDINGLQVSRSELNPDRPRMGVLSNYHYLGYQQGKQKSTADLTALPIGRDTSSLDLLVEAVRGKNHPTGIVLKNWQMLDQVCILPVNDGTCAAQGWKFQLRNSRGKLQKATVHHVEEAGILRSSYGVKPPALRGKQLAVTLSAPGYEDLEMVLTLR